MCNWDFLYQHHDSGGQREGTMGAIVDVPPLLSHATMLLGSYILQTVNKRQMQALQQTMQSLLLYYGGLQGCQDHHVRSFLHLQDQSDEQPWRADIATLGLWEWQVLSCLSAADWKPTFEKDDPTLAGSVDDRLYCNFKLESVLPMR